MEEREDCYENQSGKVEFAILYQGYFNGVQTRILSTNKEGAVTYGFWWRRCGHL